MARNNPGRWRRKVIIAFTCLFEVVRFLEEAT